MDNLLDLLEQGFMQRAMIAGGLMGILGALLGSFVILRQLTFFSHTVGHAAIVGIAMGVLLGVNPDWLIAPCILLLGLGLQYFTEKSDLNSEIILSTMLSGSIAVGIILIGFISGYRGSLFNFLFGDILAVNEWDIYKCLVLLLICALFLLLTLKEQVLLTLNQQMAIVHGIPVRFYRYIFTILLSLVVAVAIKAIGILLVNAFLVIPPASAKLLTRKFTSFLTLGTLLGCFSAIFGMLFSGLFNTSSGPTIVLVQVSIFLGALLLSKVWKFPLAEEELFKGQRAKLDPKHSEPQ
jgi:zinc transport system permease protein